MSGLRKLAYCYLVSAAAFGSAASLAAHPEIGRAAAALTYRLHRALWTPVVEKVLKPIRDTAWRADMALLDAPDSNARVVLALAPPGSDDGRTLAHVDLPRPHRASLVDGPSATVMLDAPVLIAPDLPPSAVRPAPRLGRSVPEVPRDAGAPLTAEQRRAAARLAAMLTPPMRQNFDLFLFVSKASRGPLAQRMYVFTKEEGKLKLLYDWAASTGREQQEVDARGRPSFTATPAGFYEFDPDRMYHQYRSQAWDQSMPYAMFFNWQREGLQTGLAIHAASGEDIERLGVRASAGCIHLAPENAKALFALVRGQYRGNVPRFAIDSDDTMSNRGRFAQKIDGSLAMADGYRVLIDIENYGGDDNNADAVALF